MAIEQGIKAFFGGNALVAVIVLALITIFLFREGFGFFGQNLANLRLYREAGLEYVDIIRAVSAKHEALSRNLSEIRLREVRTMEKQNAPLEEINAALAPFDQFATAFSDTAENLHGIVSDLTDQASALKEALFARAELLAQRNQLERSGAHAAAAKIVVPEVDRAAALASLREGSANFESVSAEMTAQLYNLLAQAPPLPDPAGQKAFEQWKTRTRRIPRRIARGFREIADLVARCADPMVSLDQFFSLWSRMGHGEFLAGLVRDYSLAGRIDSRLARRVVFRRAARCGVSNLCE